MKIHNYHFLLFFVFALLLVACETEIDNDPIVENFAYRLSDTNGMGLTPVKGDEYNELEENPFVKTSQVPVSTFSIDADGASYANVRRFINNGQFPPKHAVRTEELVNYFQLDYPQIPGHPVSLNGEVSSCPWNAGNKLVRIGIKGNSEPVEELPPSNIVCLIDVSGSMSSPDKLDLLKQGFNLLVDRLTARDRIAIVTYAGSTGIALQSTPGDKKDVIKSALNGLGSDGSTAGAEGIITAYEIALQNFIKGGNNRIIVGTDGDFNVGISSQEELIELIEKKRDSGIFLTVLGVGRGNLNDGSLEQIADHGNGTYEYIDNIEQARKVFIYEFNKFYPAAQDVKVQVAFNPALVEAYRLIGYENRLLENKDFEDDTKDAGEISIGQNVTVLYEIKPASESFTRQNPTFTIEFRYKQPGSDTSTPMSLEIFDNGTDFSQSSDPMIFAASVAGFGMLLRNSDYKGDMTYDDILSWSSGSLDYDPNGFRSEFRELVEKVKGL